MGSSYLTARVCGLALSLSCLVSETCQMADGAYSMLIVDNNVNGTKILCSSTKVGTYMRKSFIIKQIFDICVVLQHPPN